MTFNERSYHSATFELLGFEPEHCAHATKLVAEAEARLGFGLPESVRDWYCRRRAIELMEENSNSDHPISLERFRTFSWQAHRLLPFRIENQGVCTWAFLLDRSDDPPVYVDVESNGKQWHLAAPSFSQFLSSCVWDYTRVFLQPGLLQAQNRPLSDPALTFLRRHFSERAATFAWPGHTQYRFCDSKGAILIWASEDQSDWFIASSDTKGLEAILNAIWTVDELADSLYSTSEFGEAVLNARRKNG